MEKNETTTVTETTKTQVLAFLVDRVLARLEDELNDAIAEELETILNERGINDEDDELMHELFSRVFLSYQ